MKKITTFTKNHQFSDEIKQLIPGGCHTYSKGDDQFPYLAPKGIVRGKGVRVWDLDDNEYIDWAMGLTAVSLGHAYEPVLEVVREQLLKGENFQRPSVLELQFAKQLKELFPQYDMFKFAKNGSTVTTAAVKLSRAYTGRLKVAICAEHPFFSYDDWFIGTTACNYGVPEEHANLTAKFHFNDIASVRKMFEENRDQIACVILEAMKFDLPENDFLKELQAECKKNGAVFILDEMITGFRFDLGGAEKYFELEPDLATFGKGVGNGFSMAFLAGKREIMELGDITPGRRKVFLVSTTHGAEAHTIAAAMKTIDILRNEQVIEKNWEKGKYLVERLKAIIAENGLEKFMEVTGLPIWPAIIYRDSTGQVSLPYKTYFMQEMIARGFLFQGTFTFAHEHTYEIIDITLEAFNECCVLYKSAIEKGDLEGLLVGDSIKPVFREVN